MKKIETKDHLRAAYALQKIEEYTAPRPIFIGSEAEALYALEEKRSKIVRECAHEWSKVCDVPKEDFWKVAIPQTLFDMMSNYETGASIIACETFLLRAGYTLERPNFENPDSDTKAA